MKKLFTYSLAALSFSFVTLTYAQAQIAPSGAQTAPAAAATGEINRANLKPGWKIKFFQMQGYGNTPTIGEVPLKTAIVPANDVKAYGLVKTLNLPLGRYAYEMTGYLNITEAGDYGFDFLVETDFKKESRVSCQYSLTINDETLFNDVKNADPVIRSNKMVTLQAGLIPAKLNVACHYVNANTFDYTALTTTLSVKKPFDEEIKLPDANFVLHEQK